MARVTPDEFGNVTYPGDGFAYRGSEYTARFKQLELAAGPGGSGWIQLPDGSFRSWKKVETVVPPYIRELIGAGKYFLTALAAIYTLNLIAKWKK